MMRFTMAVLFVACLGHTAIPAPHDEQPTGLVLPDNYLALTFSPDGKTIATTRAYQQKIELWDASTGKLTKKFKFPKKQYGWLYDLAYSPDGSTLVSCGELGFTVQLWDVKTGKQVLMLEGHTHPVNAVAVSPDGRQIVSGAEQVRLWDSQTGKASIVLEGQKENLEDSICTVAFSPDGNALASLSRLGEIRVWDVKTGKGISTLKTTTGWHSTLAFDADGKSLLTASTGKSIQRWNLATGKAATITLKVEEALTKMALSPDQKLLAGGTVKGSVLLWDVATGKQLATLSKHSSRVYVLAFSPDGKTVVSGSDEPALKFDKVPDKLEK